MTKSAGAISLAILASAVPAVAGAPMAKTRVIGAPAGTGGMPAVAESYADAPGYTIYRPVQMPSHRLPLVLWGNGGCRDNGLSASHFLREIASHGYVIVANGAPREERPALARLTIENGPRPIANAPSRATPDETQVSQLLSAIDWLGGTALVGHVDRTRIAVMGHSCGGLQAISAGSDPRIDTVVAFNSGVYIRAGFGLSGVGVVKEDLRKLHTPIAYILGGPTDIAYPNSSDDVARISHVPIFYGNLDVGHGGTFALTNGGDYARVGAAWLDWQLKGKKSSGKLFAGRHCGLCTDSRWTLVRKQFPGKP